MSNDNFKNDASKNLIDLNAIRIDPHENRGAAILQTLVSVPVRKPNKEEWVIVRPDAEYSIRVGIVELTTEQEIYLVVPELVPTLTDETTFAQRMLFSTMTRRGTFFLWPVRLPDCEGRLDSWNRSALEAAKYAQQKWCRITPNMQLKAYDIKVMKAQVAAPVWPGESFAELVSIAFKDKVITTADHPVLQRLRGEI